MSEEVKVSEGGSVLIFRTLHPEREEGRGYAVSRLGYVLWNGRGSCWMVVCGE